jgi:MFS family permease
VWWLVAGIVLFSLGEMTTGPKKSEYLGLIAPPGKKGLYLGYVNIPVGLGVFAGSKLAGYLYGNYGEKAVLALKYIAEHTPYGKERGWDGEVLGLEASMAIKRPEAFAKLQELTGMDAHQATRLLWDTYDPQYFVWIPFAIVGVFAAAALWVFGRMAKKWKDMDA